MIISYLAGGALIDIEFDATLREEHGGTTTITQYHVERNSDITDNARPENRRVSFDVEVTNTPIRVPNSNRDGIDGGFSQKQLNTKVITQIPRILPGVGAITSLLAPQSQVTGISVLNFDGEMRRTQSVLNDLELLRESATLVTISTPVREYADMLIQTVSAPRTSASGSSITFTISAIGVHFVDSAVVTVRTETAKKKPLGQKPGGKADAPLTSLSKAAAIKAGAASATVRSARVPVVP